MIKWTFAILLVATCTGASAATFTVNVLFDDTFSSDSNPGDGVCLEDFPGSTNCTLRAAIEEANALAGPDRIEFSAAGEIGPDSGLLGAFPYITDDLVIDGSNAPGWSPLQPSIYLDGAAVAAVTSSFAAGLRVTSGALEVYNLGIVAFPGPLIEFDNGDAGGRVDGCVLGLDASGDPDPHPKSLSSSGVKLNDNNAIIGRTGPPGNVTGLGNVISGNRGPGIFIWGDGNEVLGNIIGMSLDGLLARGNAANTGAGILLIAGVNDTPDNNRIGGGSPGDGSGNHIANNGFAGIEVVGNNNIVDGNTFGFKPGAGVFFDNSTTAIKVAGDGHAIGGTVGNQIINRRGSGIAAIQLGFVSGSTDQPATNVTVKGNEIGTDTASLGSRYGLRVSVAGSTSNTISENRINNTVFGIELNSDGNTVTGNLLGIEPELGPGNHWGIQISSSSNNEITENTIGNSRFEAMLVDGDFNFIFANDIGFATGIGAVANGRGGIEIGSGTDMLIQGNRILNNGGPGVAIRDIQSIHGITIFGNSIRSNDGIGIDILEFDDGFVPGPTLNDPGDADTGANRRMNYPEFGEAVPIPGTDPIETVVTFTVDSDPANQAYPITVDFYRADGYGELSGDEYISSAVYDTFGTEKTVTLTLPAGTGIDGHFSATATDADGNTSEFAPAGSLGEVLFRDSYED